MVNIVQVNFISDFRSLYFGQQGNELTVHYESSFHEYIDDMWDKAVQNTKKALP